MNNFYPLPEWHPQDATVLVWPHRYSDWSDSLDVISATYIELTKVIADHQHVIIIYYDHEHRDLINTECSKCGCNMNHIRLLQIETNDTWVRDYGPQLLLGNQEYQYVDLEFNAWGEQYPYRLDNLFSESLFYHLVDQSTCTYYRAPIVIEGGNLDFDSNASLLINLSCVIQNNSALKIKKEDLIDVIKRELSVKRVLGIELEPLMGDDTGGHIDTLARFINDDTIVYAHTQNKNDPNYSTLKQLHEQLTQFKTGKGKAYRLVPIQNPVYEPEINEEDYPPASYINFIFINDAMIIPMYDNIKDAEALKKFSDLLPDRKIIGVNANSLLSQFGSLHCATLHIPEKVLHESRLNSAK